MASEMFGKTYIVKVLDDGECITEGELIRCKDCRHWDCDDSESYCLELGIFNTDMNSYCSYAKRKEHETN